MFNSRLNNIHIVAAFNSLDRSKYGFDKILAPLVRDIKQLEHGVDLTLRDGTVVHKRGTVVLLAGDNLGLNQLCGFVESFSATHFCRLCMTDKADSSSTCTDYCLQLRTREQYSQQLECLQSGTLTTKDCGIKRSCLLNDLQYFHIAENVTVDPMHDLVIVGDAGDEPSFCSIVRCLVVADNIVHFVCQKLAIKYYDSHLHAYVVKTGTGLQVVDHRDLKYYKPQCLRHMFDSSCDYVVFP